MDNSKNVSKSLGVWAGIICLLVQGTAAGEKLSAGEVQTIADSILQLITAVFTLVQIYGRIRATHKITLAPAPPTTGK